MNRTASRSRSRLRLSERKLLLALVDVLLVNGSLLASLDLRTAQIAQAANFYGQLKWYVTLTAVWFLCAVVFHAYDLTRAARVGRSLRVAVPATLATAAIYTAIPWLTPIIVNRTQPLLFALLAVLAITGWRWVYAQYLVRPGFFNRNVLVVGAGKSGHRLAAVYKAEEKEIFQSTGYQLIGFLDDGEVPEEIGGFPWLGRGSDLLAIVTQQEVDEVVISISNTETIHPSLFESILKCREQGLPVTTMSSHYERLTGRVPVEFVSRDVELAAGVKESPLQRINEIAKRLLDIFGGLALLASLVIIAPIIALVNRFVSPGPLFFRQERVGQHGQPFVVTKFRSMVPDAESEGAVWARRNDNRVTKVGRVLRLTHLDEFPQAWNVLRGEMSLVGPRPERPEFVEGLVEQIPFYRARHAAKPGITGWAQIHQEYGGSVEDILEKLEYDLYYVKYWTVLFDFFVLLRTVSKVVGMGGR